jgi:predicted transcriptional regulator
MIHARHVSSSDQAAFILPPQIQLLGWRERQIASIIYREGAMTAKALQARLADELSNAAVRSMLVRLCTKRILRRRKRTVECKEGARRVAFIYLPALETDDVRQSALRQLAEDYFGGSLLMVAQASIGLLHDGPAEDGKQRRVAGAFQQTGPSGGSPAH